MYIINLLRGHVTSGGSSVVRMRRNIGGVGRARELTDPAERPRGRAQIHTDWDTHGIRNISTCTSGTGTHNFMLRGATCRGRQGRTDSYHELYDMIAALLVGLLVFKSRNAGTTFQTAGEGTLFKSRNAGTTFQTAGEGTLFNFRTADITFRIAGDGIRLQAAGEGTRLLIADDGNAPFKYESVWAARTHLIRECQEGHHHTRLQTVAANRGGRRNTPTARYVRMAHHVLESSPVSRTMLPPGRMQGTSTWPGRPPGSPTSMEVDEAGQTDRVATTDAEIGSLMTQARQTANGSRGHGLPAIGSFNEFINGIYSDLKIANAFPDVWEANMEVLRGVKMLPEILPSTLEVSSHTVGAPKEDEYVTPLDSSELYADSWEELLESIEEALEPEGLRQYVGKAAPLWVPLHRLHECVEDPLQPPSGSGVGSGGLRPGSARIEAGRKLLMHHETVLRNLANPKATSRSGQMLAQSKLPLVPLALIGYVDEALREISRRLLGPNGRPGVDLLKERQLDQLTPEQTNIWAVTVKYLESRVRDMSAAAGEAMKTVLAEVAGLALMSGRVAAAAVTDPELCAMAEPAAVRVMVRAIRSAEQVTLRATNYKMGNVQFVNMLTLHSVNDSLGVCRYAIGIMSDSADETQKEGLTKLREVLPAVLDMPSQPIKFDNDVMTIARLTQLLWSMDRALSLQRMLSHPRGEMALKKWLQSNTPKDIPDLEPYLRIKALDSCELLMGKAPSTGEEALLTLRDHATVLIFLAAATATTALRAPVIIVADVGVDDAAALLWAVYAPSLDVLGVASTFGCHADPEQTAANARKLLEAANRSDIPVYVGSRFPLGESTPLLLDGSRFHGTNGFGSVTDGCVPESKAVLPSISAVEFIAKTAREYPGIVTLLCFSPLTDIALALLLERSLPFMLKKLVIMGAAVYSPGHASPLAEANFFHDAAAARAISSISESSFPQFVQSQAYLPLAEDMLQGERHQKQDDLMWNKYNLLVDCAGWTRASVSMSEWYPACIVLARGVDCHVKVTNYRKDGDLFKNLLTMRPVYDSNGVRRFSIGVRFEVTRNTNLKAMLSKLKELLEYYLSSVPSGTSVAWNEEQTKMITRVVKDVLFRSIQAARRKDGFSRTAMFKVESSTRAELAKESADELRKLAALDVIRERLSMRLQETGTLCVHLIREKGLLATGLVGTANPYVFVSAGGQQQQNHVVTSDVNPNFDQVLKFYDEPYDFVSSPLILKLFDADRLGGHHALGDVRRCIKALRYLDMIEFSDELPSRGTIEFSVSWENQSATQGAQADPEPKRSAVTGTPRTVAVIEIRAKIVPSKKGRFLGRKHCESNGGMGSTANNFTSLQSQPGAPQSKCFMSTTRSTTALKVGHDKQTDWRDYDFGMESQFGFQDTYYPPTEN